MRRFLFVSLLVIGVALVGCSDDDEDVTQPPTPEEQAQAEATATAALGDLVDAMEEAMSGGLDPDALMDMDMDPFTDGADDALDLDPDCVTAHFLMAVCEFILMAQDEELAAWLDAVEDEFGDLGSGFALQLSPLRQFQLFQGGLLGRSFAIMSRAPLALPPAELSLAPRSADKADGPLIRQLQTIVHDRLLPATASIANHLGVVEDHPDWRILIIDEAAEPDTSEFDVGEVYVLDACVRALRSGLLVATAYDVEVAPEGDYSWITDQLTYYGYTDYEVVPGDENGNYLIIHDDQEVSARRAEAFIGEVAGLLQEDSDFLTLWTDPWSGASALEDGYGEMGELLGKLEAAYEFINDEEDDQADDIISQLAMAELDSAIADLGEGLPEWIGTWETIPDVIDWVEEVMDGPYTIPVELEPEVTFDLVVDISALFLEPVDDWKTKLPYHEFLAFEQWATFVGPIDTDFIPWNPAWPFDLTVAGEQVSIPNISYYKYVGEEWDIASPFRFLDGEDGDPIEEGFPYFPDYTFGGLFPEMNRDAWLTLLEVE
ncbi:MAG TPA: hypothetical protein PLL30_01440 [Candidatus Krumholzibacteria bacterium]|nr:hypothetical protein [Candidatus Krumholzibacteria bacterium]HPD70427.1 hypothetical protein [Candidatus Krumholzibacteria bacterium]HRY39873.1 hypothetical protein [Candidatus Krumholzibacteria bacterium]